MRVPAGPGGGGDVDVAMMSSRLVPGTSARCRIVRLNAETWAGADDGSRIGDSTTPSVISAVYNTMLLSTVRFPHDGVAVNPGMVGKRWSEVNVAITTGTGGSGHSG
jgi:hypothetical protein